MGWGFRIRKAIEAVVMTLLAFAFVVGVMALTLGLYLWVIGFFDSTGR